MVRLKRPLLLATGAACVAQLPKPSKFRRLNLAAASGPPPESKTPFVAKLESAAAALRPGIPRGGVLPCRSLERRKISAHLRAGVQRGGSSQVLYVSGMPGTGKTAIVLEVLEKMRSQCEFYLVHVNAMRLGAPVQVFREIADQMLCDTSNSDACSDLAELFKTRQAEDPVVVLLIDEVDCLVTPTQAVLYKVFDWLGMPNSRIVLAAISNTMDLPERLLPRVASRFHIERVDFAPYNKDQLYEILCSRLRGQGALDSFGDVVLRLCSARVAAATGDIRKALQVCRRAVETRLQTASEGVVSIADLTASEKELIFANPIAQAILGLSSQARRFLSAIVIELRRKDSEVVHFRKAIMRFRKLLDLVAVDCERGCATDAEADEMNTAVEIHEVGELLVDRLEALSILRKENESPSCNELVSSEPMLSLGSLDVEDLTSTLVRVEEDALVKELLEGGRPGSEAVRVGRPLD